MAKTSALDVLADMSGSAFVLTPAKAAKADSLTPEAVREAAGTVLTHKSAADRIVGDVMWEAGLLTHYVTVTAKAIGSDGLWEAQGDYAKAIGYSPAYVTRLKRLGRAAVVHGVRKGSARWTFLASFADRAEVGQAVKSDDREEFEAVIDALIESTRKAGKYAVPGAETPAIEGGEQGANRTPSGETEVTEREADRETVVTTIGDMREAFRVLASKVKDLSNEDWSAVEDMWESLRSNENTRRVTLAQAARKAAK